jgi:hypothetical protein
MNLDVFLTDHGHRPEADRVTADPRLAYAGPAVAGVVSELETMVFEHPEHGWRAVGEGDLAQGARI